MVSSVGFAGNVRLVHEVRSTEAVSKSPHANELRVVSVRRAYAWHVPPAVLATPTCKIIGEDLTHPRRIFGGLRRVPDLPVLGVAPHPSNKGNMLMRCNIRA